MNILIVSNSFPASYDDWAAPFAYAFSHALHQKGHRLTVLAPERTEKWADTHPFPVIRLPARGCLSKDEGLSMASPGKLRALLKLHSVAKRTVLELYAKETFDIGLAMWSVPSGIWLAEAKKRYGLPYITWSLGSDIWKAGQIPVIKNIVEDVLFEADCRFADGYALAAQVRKISGKECLFLPTARRLPLSKDRHDGSIKDKKVFIFVGRWEPVKGGDVLIRAFARADLKDSILIMYGLGSQEEKYRKLIEECGAKDRIFLRGYADPQMVSDHMATAHCCVIPSRNESIPVIFSDALQKGCPIIATQVGDMGSLIAQYDCGIAVPADNVESLMDALQKMAVYDRSDFTEGLRKASEVFQIESIAGEFLKQARSVVDNHTKSNCAV